MELNEVKIGDKVTFKNKGKKVVGKVIHRHDERKSPHLYGHVNVQKIGGSPSYPITIHISKLQPMLEETHMADLREDIKSMLQDIIDGNNVHANATFEVLLQQKIAELVDLAKVEVAGAMFSTQTEDVDLEEAKDSYEIYHNHYNAAVNHAAEHVHKKTGLHVHERDLMNIPRKPAQGETNSLRFQLHKDGQPTDKYAHVQVYHHDGKTKKPFELNMYHDTGKHKLTKEEVEQMDEGNAANKAKKNAFVSTLAKKAYTHWREPAVKQGRDTLKADPNVLRHRNKMKAALYAKEREAFDQEIKAQNAKKNEQVEQINEVITKKTATGDVIRDFVHSKNSRFKGKSKKERIRMALGAKYSMMKEALVGGQKKLDMNHNNKLDAQDFKIIRKKKK